jgi:hypothetical protein
MSDVPIVRCVVVGSRVIDDDAYEFVRRTMLGFFARTVAAHGGPENVRVQFVLPSEKGRDGVGRTVRGVSRMAGHMLRVAREQKNDSPSAKALLMPLHIEIDWENNVFTDEKRVVAANFRWAQNIFDADSEHWGMDSVVPSAVIGIESGVDRWVRYVVAQAEKFGVRDSERMLSRFIPRSAPVLF